MPPKKVKPSENKGKRKRKDSSSDPSESSVDDSSSPESDTSDSDSSVSDTDESEDEDEEKEKKGDAVSDDESDDSDDSDSNTEDDGDEGDESDQEEEEEEDGEPAGQSPKDDGSSTGVQYTAKGEVRKRNYRWTKEERYALFYTCLKQEDDLKKRGADPEGVKEAAWQAVLDAINAVENRNRNKKQMRKQINDFFSRSKLKNKKLLKKMKKSSKPLKVGCTALEVMCLKYKDHPNIVGPDGKIIVSSATPKKKSKKVVSSKAKSSKETKSPSKGKVKKASVISTPKKKTGKKKTSPETKKGSTETTPEKKKGKSKPTATGKKNPKKKTPPKKVPAKQNPRKKTKTVRNRKPLPDMEDSPSMDLYTNDPGLIDLSEDEDLKITYYSMSNTDASISSKIKDERSSEIVMDLTGSKPSLSSTPRPVVIDDDKEGNLPDLSPTDQPPVKQPVRRSPRNVKDKDSTEKSSVKEVTSTSQAKKQLKYDTRSDAVAGPSGTQGQASSASGMKEASGSKEVIGQSGLEDDMCMRVARLESLITTMEIERRDEVKHRREQEYRHIELSSRISCVLERISSDRTVLIKAFDAAMANQHEMCQVIGRLIRAVDWSPMKRTKMVQTDNLDVLGAVPLIVKEVDKAGQVLHVQAVDSTIPSDVPLQLSPGGSIVPKTTPIDLSVAAPSTDAITNAPREPIDLVTSQTLEQQDVLASQTVTNVTEIKPIENADSQSGTGNTKCQSEGENNPPVTDENSIVNMGHKNGEHTPITGTDQTNAKAITHNTDEPAITDVVSNVILGEIVQVEITEQKLSGFTVGTHPSEPSAVNDQNIVEQERKDCEQDGTEKGSGCGEKTDEHSGSNEKSDTSPVEQVSPETDIDDGHLVATAEVAVSVLTSIETTEPLTKKIKVEPPSETSEEEQPKSKGKASKKGKAKGKSSTANKKKKKR